MSLTRVAGVGRLARRRQGQLTSGALTRVLVLGQTPPPYGGQTIMVETLVAGSYAKLSVRLVQIRLSQSLGSMGRLSWRKVARLTIVPFRVAVQCLVWRPTVLYYHPAGGSRSAVYRDLALLPLIRPMFRHTVFHFHAGGLSDAYPTLPPQCRPLFWKAFGHPTLVIRPSAAAVDEGPFLRATRSVVVSNATRGGRAVARTRQPATPRILFLNLISREKGALILLRAVASLRRSGMSVEVCFAGEFPDVATEISFLQLVSELHIGDCVRLLGVVAGDHKWQAYQQADIFCFPSHHPTETFGLVMAEAASCALAIVASQHGAVASVFSEEAALLFSPHDVEDLALKLRCLIEDSALRLRLGSNARAEFEARYTVQRFWSDLDNLVGGLT